MFSIDSLVLSYSDVPAAKRWWISALHCTEADVPADWDDTSPADVALCLPGERDPAILLRAKDQSEPPDGTLEHPLIYCTNAKKARESLLKRGVSAGPIQESGAKFFEIIDPEGNTIEICEQP